jgi:hypothetical protein
MMWGVVGRQAGEVGRLILKVTHCSLCLFLLQKNIPFGLLFQIFSILGLGFRFTPCSMHTCRDRSLPLVTISVEILEEGAPAGYFALVDLDFSFPQKSVGFSGIGLGVSMLVFLLLGLSVR